MDEEARRALEMSEADLNARFEAGSRRPKVARKAPWRVRGKKDMNQRAAAIVAEATGANETLAGEWNVSTVVITGLGTHKRDDQPTRLPGRSAVTVEP